VSEREREREREMGEKREKEERDRERERERGKDRETSCLGGRRAKNGHLYHPSLSLFSHVRNGGIIDNSNADFSHCYS
jgi:hypothetical protein